MGLEEQQEEREVLDSIFPDEITDVSPDSYRIAIALDVPPEPGAPEPEPDEAPPPPPTILLLVSLPPTYPTTPPSLDLSLPPSAPRIPHLSFPTDRAPLLAALDAPIDENLGMQMVFTLVSHLKDAAEALITERQGAKRAEIEKERVKREEEENRKFVGEAVTRESFETWRAAFKAEMREKEEERRRKEEEGGGGGGEGKKKGAGGKVGWEGKTGRELWESGLVGQAEDEDVDEDEEEAGGAGEGAGGGGLEEGVESLKVEE